MANSGETFTLARDACSIIGSFINAMNVQHKVAERRKLVFVMSVANEMGWGLGGCATALGQRGAQRRCQRGAR